MSLQNILSFGPTGRLTMEPLNVLIGPNGCGKSNFIEALGLLRAAPTDVRIPIREGGGAEDWIWKGKPRPSTARVEVVVDNPRGRQPLRYRLEFGTGGGRFSLTSEILENKDPYPDKDRPYIYLDLQGGRATLNYHDPDDVVRSRQLRLEEVDVDQSILAQRKDPDHYPEITYLGSEFAKMRFYREWSFGRSATPRLPQKLDLPNDFLLEDGANLGLVGAVQLFLREGNIMIPATRLSDGTLRYLCLVAILCDPTPPPLVCLEEPELGLHPDVLPQLADLLRNASDRCQLIVTTHSDTLVDALTEDAQSVVVCEKPEGQTTMKRLEKNKLTHWLEQYRLGQLWSSGEIGGNRWQGGEPDPEMVAAASPHVRRLLDRLRSAPS